MKFWCMQLHPGEKDISKKIKKTEETLNCGVIGLDYGVNEEYLSNLSEEEQKKYEELYKKPLYQMNNNEREFLAGLIDRAREKQGEDAAGPGYPFDQLFRYFCDEMKEGDIVLIQAGHTKPIDIVVVTSPVYFCKQDCSTCSKYDKDWCIIQKNCKNKFPWCRHVRNVERLYIPEDELFLNRGLGQTIKPIFREELKEKMKNILNKYSKKYHQIIKKIKQRWLEMQIKEIIETFNNSKFHQIILYGPPGTGKTYLVKQVAARMLGVEPDSKEFKEKIFKPGKSQDGAWAIVQFHPSYNYEDFVRGIKITAKEKGEIAYEVEDRIFVQMCKEAWRYCKKRCNGKIPEDCPKEDCKKYILIIDEINRANLAAVLGELIYALEYRGEAVRLPYEKDGETELIVPPNLYIIGTMNTADKSIGHIDYAVRRRFAFVQVLPDEKVIENYYRNFSDEALKETALKLFHAVKELFERKENSEGQSCLSPDYHKEDVQPGHSYFLVKSKNKDEQIDELAYKFAYQVWPLLKEYYKDGVLIGENCELKEIKIKKEDGEDESLKLNMEVRPDKLISAIKDLYESIRNKSQPKSSEKEEMSQEESNKNS